VVGMRITGVRTVNLDPEAQTYDGESDSAAAPASGGGEKTPATRVEAGTQQFSERVRVIYTAAPIT
jgi:hypothetical protein